MKDIHFFYRHPHPIYFSIEKIFSAVSSEINEGVRFRAKNIMLPFMGGLWSVWKNIAFVRKHQAPINHITGDAHYAILGCNNQSLNILTVHDCVLLRQIPRSNPRFWLIKWLWYDLPVKHAHGITVISENTKNELIHFTRCSPAKIRVIGNFLDSGFSFDPRPFNKAKPVILFIGTAKNKNLNRLLAAVQGLPIMLDIVGVPTEAQAQQIKTLGIENRQSARLSADEMKKRYRDCDILAFPSTYEGFGLPIIEAQATGRPVLTADRSPMQEVAGNAACLVDPYNIASIRAGLQKIVQDDGYREHLISAGMSNVERFKLKTITAAYTALYEELQNNKQA